MTIFVSKMSELALLVVSLHPSKLTEADTLQFEDTERDGGDR